MSCNQLSNYVGLYVWLVLFSLRTSLDRFRQFGAMLSSNFFSLLRQIHHWLVCLGGKKY